MAIKLENKTNVTAPGGNFPYGDIKDDSGGNNGTPVNRSVYGDFHQFFARIMDVGGIVYNNAVENSANGFQYVTALIAIIVAQATALVSAEAALRTSADNTLQSNITSEAGTRAAADTTLQNNINAEASTRSSTDTSLQTQIDAINANKYDDERDSPTDGSQITVITIPTTNNKNIRVVAELVSRRLSGGSVSDSSLKKKITLYRNVSGVLTQVGEENEFIDIVSGAAAPDLDFGTSGSDITVKVQAGSGSGFRIKTHAEKSEV